MLFKKNEFIEHVYKNSDSNLKKDQIIAILNILVDELKKDFDNFKMTRIKNFGEFGMKESQKKTYWNQTLKQFLPTKKRFRANFKLTRKLRVLIYKYLDKDSI